MKPANHKSVKSIMSIVANRFAANKDVSFVRSGSSNQLYLWKCRNKLLGICILTAPFMTYLECSSQQKQ